MVIAIPAVEVADDADAASLWGPDRERDAFRATDFRDVRAEFFIDLLVAALAEKMQVDLA